MEENIPVSNENTSSQRTAIEVLEKLGFKIKKDQLPTDIAGITDTFKGIRLKLYGGKTKTTFLSLAPIFLETVSIPFFNSFKTFSLSTIL